MPSIGGVLSQATLSPHPDWKYSQHFGCKLSYMDIEVPFVIMRKQEGVH